MDKMTKDKIIGALMGSFYGDALGIPLETLDYDTIRNDYGRVLTYLRPDGHNWYDGWRPGRWSDDGQQILAVMRAFTQTPFINLYLMATNMAGEMRRSPRGWGKSSRRAMENIAKGLPLHASGTWEGAGNGTVMRALPMAVYIESRYPRLSLFKGIPEYMRYYAACYAAMTHRSDMAVAAAFGHIQALRYCLRTQAGDFGPIDFLDIVLNGMEQGYDYIHRPERNGPPHKLVAARLSDNLVQVIASHLCCRGPKSLAAMSDREIINRFGGGRCYVYHSLPFTYAFFLRDPHSYRTFCDVVNAGGDTDTNGSLMGGLLGALHGNRFWPPHLYDGLWRNREILGACHEFINALKL